MIDVRIPSVDLDSYDEQFTGEYWIDDKRIYKKTLSTGALPNNATSETLHNISNIDKIVAITGMAYPTNNPTFLPLPFAINVLTQTVSLYADRAKVFLVTGMNRNSYNNSIVTLYYTKTTD